MQQKEKIPEWVWLVNFFLTKNNHKNNLSLVNIKLNEKFKTKDLF